MEEQGVALGDLTPDLAADLVRRAPWRCDRQQYVAFVVKRFVKYLATQGMASRRHRDPDVTVSQQEQDQ
jgi:hypothetical protein